MTQPTLFVEEIRVVVDEAFVHLVGFTTVDGSRDSEHLPASHLVMSNAAFRKLLADGRCKLAKGGH
ncbi:hypothetical protein EN875_032275 [Mesorhizobium sp. M2D.F.Ca.ET.232.01.1.1]|uniref:hypothetical protein n=1 Tax=Mesorhizobium sp. M2D.F.Ca.ET.232.01.1.1 TaxID=2496670 RepID=UPI000FCA94F5|nr:hypothetical protein [Mesorhizobium sp. M2D.F.Ca.ET.232.01.1.1]TGP28235.1 hypothetical protein EN875_032275 [Mesorhizobium sp. M2D.F.Ca.ET.232.01.1.1]